MIPVVIPSKTAGNVEACVAAIRQHEPRANFICVDDGLSRVPAGVSVIPGAKPFVFARNVNIGINHAIETYPCKGVVIMNDDAKLTSTDGLSKLICAADENPQYGIIGATCNNIGNRNQFQRGIGLREDPRMICFVCAYIPRTTIETVGLLDERFVGYGFEDDDYCVRIRKAGLKIGIHDGCFVDHLSLPSSFRGDPRRPADLADNHRIFQQKWGARNHNI